MVTPLYTHMDLSCNTKKCKKQKWNIYVHHYLLWMSNARWSGWWYKNNVIRTESISSNGMMSKCLTYMYILEYPAFKIIYLLCSLTQNPDRPICACDLKACWHFKRYFGYFKAAASLTFHAATLFCFVLPVTCPAQKWTDRNCVYWEIR